MERPPTPASRSDQRQGAVPRSHDGPPLPQRKHSSIGRTRVPGRTAPADLPRLCKTSTAPVGLRVRRPSSARGLRPYAARRLHRRRTSRSNSKGAASAGWGAVHAQAATTPTATDHRWFAWCRAAYVSGRGFVDHQFSERGGAWSSLSIGNVFTRLGPRLERGLMRVERRRLVCREANAARA